MENLDNTIIGVFCYKRAGKLKASMEALLKNPECANMEVVFFADGNKGEHDILGVNETRAYVDSLTGFKKIHKHYREKNLSTGPNFKAGLTYLFNNYDQFIVVEDDLVVTPNYIKYMLDALAFYRNEHQVFCVTGFAFPLQINDYKYDTIVHNRFCSYGWASWADRVKHVAFDNEGLVKIMNSNAAFKTKLNSEGRDLHRMLLKQISGEISTWDIQMQVHVSHNDMKVIYPIISKGSNIGFDEESTNTFGIDYLKTPQDSGVKRSFNFCGLDVIEPTIQRQLRKPYSLPLLATRKIINTVIKFTNRIKR